MSARAAAGASSTSGVAWYVYGVVDADVEPPEGVPGVGATVTTLREGSLGALVSHVPLDEFDEDSVRARLEDPAWLAEAAQAHEAVLAAALRSGAVVPFRLLTVFRDGDRLRDFLAVRGDDLRAALDRVRGKIEVGIKAFVDREVLDRTIAEDSPALAELDAEIASAQIGRAYLLRRRREQAVHDESTRRSVTLAEDVHARLLAAADAGVANPVQSREATGRQEEMILNGAYLVPAGDEGLERALDELRERYRDLGLTLERTGPWPPYNFVPRDPGRA